MVCVHNIIDILTVDLAHVSITSRFLNTSINVTYFVQLTLQAAWEVRMADVVLGVGTGVFIITLIWIVTLALTVVLSRANGPTK